MIEGIVFDLWNTLARNTGGTDPMRLLAGALGVASEPDWGLRISRGMMLAPAAGIEGALRQIEAREGLAIGDPEARRDVIRRWATAGEDAELFPDVVPLLTILRRDYRIGLISNTQSFGLEFLGRDGLWDLLDASALSFEVGALKPRREIFAALASRIGLAPDKLLMVGDHPRDDVQGARAAGMHAVRLARPELDGSRYASADDGPSLPDLASLPDWASELQPATTGGTFRVPSRGP